MPQRVSIPVIGTSRSKMRPSVGLRNPAIRLRSVDLPQPELPTMHRISPSCTSSDSPPNARTTSGPRWYSILTFSIRMIGRSVATTRSLSLLLMAMPRDQAMFDESDYGIERENGRADRQHADDDLSDIGPVFCIPDQVAETVLRPYHLGADDACPGKGEGDLESRNDARQSTGQDDFPHNSPARGAEILSSEDINRFDPQRRVRHKNDERRKRSHEDDRVFLALAYSQPQKR